MSRTEQSGRMSLRKPKPPIKGGSVPEEEEEKEEEEEEEEETEVNQLFKYEAIKRKMEK